MAKIHMQGRDMWVFWCPGCHCAHGFSGPKWKWNGDVHNPTVEGSLDIRGQIRCHSYVEGGNIQFLSDSAHALSGQTVELPEWGSQWKGEVE